MNCKSFQYVLAMFLALMVSGTLTCCFDYDGMVMDGEEDSSEDFGIAFDIALNKTPENATRAADQHPDNYGEDIDNEVDIEGKYHDFRVLLFDENDNFLFEPTRSEEQYTVKPIDDYDYDEDYDYSGGVQTKRWRIRIPASVLKANNVLDKIKAENFKIAVLANWPKSNSNKLEFEAGKDKLYKLSHYWADNVYDESKDANKQALSFLSDDGKMGAYVEWVNNTFPKQGDERTAIHEHVRPDGLQPYQFKRQIGIGEYIYQHIWRVWNFGDDKVLSEATTNFQTYWSRKVEKEKLRLINSSTRLDNYAPTTEGGEDGLSFTSGGNNQYNENNGCITIVQGLSNSSHSDGTEITNNYFSFKAYAAGTLVVWARSKSNNPTYIGVQQGNYNAPADRIDNRNKLTDKDVVKMTDPNTIYKHEFSVAVTGTNTDGSSYKGEPVNVKVYAIDGNVDILQIEYIEDDYLYNTDREGYLPSKTKLIPMYGIQEFDAIGAYFVPGRIFNLSTPSDMEPSDDYNRKKVHLLRSVAKVELMIPAGLQLTHAYMRSSNRHGRCEPIDVSTPTDELWRNIDTEIENIKNYGPFYDGSEKDKNYQAYRDKLSWFYKAWTEWDFNKSTYPVTVPGGTDYPHIFNTRINRSDYIHFIYMETQDGYDRYVVYMPEKNIDDPNTVGNIRSTPKVPHIELRFESNDATNLDDNDCWRIYFTDSQPQVEQDEYDDFEKNSENLKTLYPIVRNHIYRFTVNLSNRSVVCTVRKWDRHSTEIRFD